MYTYLYFVLQIFYLAIQFCTKDQSILVLPAISIIAMILFQ